MNKKEKIKLKIEFYKNLQLTVETTEKKKQINKTIIQLKKLLNQI